MNTRASVRPAIAGATLMLMALTGCGGGGKGGEGPAPAPPPAAPAPPPPPPPAASFSVGGSVSGLSGSGLTIRNNGGAALPVANGPFTIATAQPDGAAYAVTVSAQPTEPWQTCAVSNGAGTVASADVDDIRIDCVTNTYPVSVAVSGLKGSGLALQNLGAEELTIAADGMHSFATPIASGEDYEVTVLAQPANPAQTCEVTDGAGTVADSEISVAVTCVDVPPPPVYTIGGTVSGLRGAGLRLAGLSTQVVDVAAEGLFAFPAGVPAGTPFDIHVDRQPINPAQTCTVTHGSGTVTAMDVVDVSVTCVDVTFSGVLDPGFGDDGIRRIDFNGRADHARAVAIQPDGRIIVVGDAQGANGVTITFALARLEADGALDATFGQGGLVTTQIGSISAAATAIALQPDGRIVVAGRAFIGGNFDVAVARYQPDGTLDTSFGGDGIVTTHITSSDGAGGVAVQTDGKIVVAGVARPHMNDFAVLRYHPDGTLDTTFDGDGYRLVDFGGGDDRANAIAVRPDGRVVAAGNAAGSGLSAFAFTVHEDDGSSPAFGQHHDGANGIGTAFAVQVQPDNKTVLGGYVASGGVDRFAITRYTAEGAVDVTFNGTGRNHTPIGIGEARAFALTSRADFKWALAGRAFNGVNYDFALARYQLDGALDTGFGSGGAVSFPVGGDHDEAYGIAAQADLKLIVVGDTINGAYSDFAVVRVLD